MVISSSSVGGGNGDMSIANANLALEWFSAAGRLGFDLFDESTTPPSPPPGYAWVYNEKWTIIHEG